MHQRLLEVVGTGRDRVLDFAVAQVVAAFPGTAGVRLDVVNFLRVQAPHFQRGKTGKHLQDRARVVVLLRGAVEHRFLHGMVEHVGPALGRDAAHEFCRLEAWRRSHGQHVAVLRIQDHGCAAGLRAEHGRHQRGLDGALQLEIQREHQVVPGLRRTQHRFLLAVAKAVDRHRFCAGRAA